MESYFIWNIDPVILNIGFYSLRYYTLLYVGGVVLFAVFVSKAFLSAGFSEKKLDSFYLFMFIGMLFGARLGHVLFYDPLEFLKNPLEILMVWHGGLASHGALIGMVIGVFLFQAKYKQFPINWLFDRSVFPIFFSGGMIRLGNFFNSEIIGIPGQVPWAVIFKRIDLIPRHPVQLYESMTYFALGILGIVFNQIPSLKNRPWFFTGYFFFSVFAARLFLENFKIKQASYQKVLGFSAGQWLSVPVIIAGILLLIYSATKPPIEVKYTHSLKDKPKVKK